MFISQKIMIITVQSIISNTGQRVHVDEQQEGDPLYYLHLRAPRRIVCAGGFLTRQVVTMTHIYEHLLCWGLLQELPKLPPH